MEECGIVFIADYGFSVPTLVAITSLLENKNVGTKYHIYLIKTFDDSRYEELLERLSKKYECIIDVISIDDNYLDNRYRGINRHECNATITALLKFDIPNLCINEDKILYIDGDVLIKKDLSDIFYYDFEPEKCIMAVLDSGGIYTKTESHNYFNSGVMYMNLEYMRNKDVPDALFFRKKEDKSISLMDQNIFNEVLKEQVMLLPHRYNVLYSNLVRARYFKGVEIDKINDFYDTNYKSFEEIYDHAAIIHYASFEKPWLYSDAIKVKEWEEYFYRTEIAIKFLKRKKLHLNIFYHTGMIGKLLWLIEKKNANTGDKAFESIKL